MRKFLSSLGVAVLLAVGLFVGQSVVAPTSVNACSYGSLAQTKSKVFTKVQIWLQVYQDGSGCRHYEAQFQNRSSGAITITDHIRVWVCGTYKGTFGGSTFTLYHTGDVLNDTTPSFSYNWWCGAQADNYWTTAAGNTYPATYLNY
jgi:hypothetical protein